VGECFFATIKASVNVQGKGLSPKLVCNVRKKNLSAAACIIYKDVNVS
jgi:hypothetical protein